MIGKEIKNLSEIEQYKFITIAVSELNPSWQVTHSELFKVVLEGQEVATFIGQIVSIYSYLMEDEKIGHQVTIRQVEKVEIN